MTLVRFSAIAAALLLSGSAAAVPLAARQRPAAPADSVVDRIVAVVGSRAILRSNIEERLLQEFPQGKGLPDSPAALAGLRRDLLDQLISEELMVQEAGRDTTIKVLEDDVTKSVDALVKTARARFPSEDAYRKDLRVAGFETPDEYRNWLTEQQRRVLTIRQLLSKLKSSGKLKPVAPTESELREYFDRNKSGFSKKSETISFRQIVVAPPPTAEARARALALADSILTELRKGADFAAAARRFTMDVATKEQGGELGWIRRGTGLDQHFEDAAFSLRPGVVSDPVESPFGFHLIQVERTQPAEVQVRHILIMPDIGATESDSARRTAERIRAALEAGAAFDSIQRIWHDKAEERDVANVPLEILPPAYSEAVNGLTAGKISPVFRLEAPVDPIRSKFAVLELTERVPAGEIRFEDVKEDIRSRLNEVLTQQRYIDRLRRATFVEVRVK